MIDNMFKVKDFIWNSLRMIDPMYVSLGMATCVVISNLQEQGCRVNILDAQHRDYRIIEVDNHEYRIVRGKDKFSHYDVRLIC